MMRTALCFLALTSCNAFTGASEREAAPVDSAVEEVDVDAAVEDDPRFVAWTPENPPQCDAEKGTVRSSHAGLYWEDTPGAAVGSLDEATAHCASLAGVAGFDDWRLPTRAELAAMGNYYLTEGPRICSADSVGIGELSDRYLCSSSTREGRVYVMSTVDAAIELVALGKCHPRCVHREKHAPRARFSKTPTGIADAVTKLVWQSDSLKNAERPAGDFTRGEASAACLALGPSWRLPFVQELLTLVDDTQSDVTIDRTFFADTAPESYWAQDIHPDLWAPGTTVALQWTVDFANGTTPPKRSDARLRVRCVRAP